MKRKTKHFVQLVTKRDPLHKTVTYKKEGCTARNSVAQELACCEQASATRNGPVPCMVYRENLCDTCDSVRYYTACCNKQCSEKNHIPREMICDKTLRALQYSEGLEMVCEEKWCASSNCVQ